MVVVHSLSTVLPLGSITLPASGQRVFDFFYEVWPFPTYPMVSEFSSVEVIKILNKLFEVSVMAVYLFDLLPKILLWNKSMLWKLTNALIVFLMVLQVPLSLIVFDFDVTEVKVRMATISLSFLLLFEILQIRDRNTQRQNLDPPLRRIYQQIPESMLQAFTWDEISLHDRHDSCWVVIHGKVYDVTNFISSHPGGDLILDGAGGDCTSYWESYHPLGLAQKGPPRKYQIGFVEDYSPFYSWDGEFYSTLKKRVEAIIPPKKRRCHWVFWVKTMLVLFGFYFSMYKYITEHTLFWTVLCGYMGSHMGVNIMHDGNHMAASNNKLLNKFAGLALEMVGGSSIVYKRSHDFGHHGCVNHLELDRSFDTTYPIFRLHQALPYQWVHKFQHIYMWLMYGSVNFGDLFSLQEEVCQFSNYPVRRGYISLRARISLFISSNTIQSIFLIVPWYYYGFYSAFSHFLLFHFVFSYGYAFIFAVNHWTQEAGHVDYNNINMSNWGKLQVENSSNFSSLSPLAVHLSGGLNLQIEHHLFPGYCHTRLPQIQKIVKDTCEEFGIRYFSFPSFWHALLSHYRALKDLSKEQ